MSLFRPARRAAPEVRGFNAGNVGLSLMSGSLDQALRLAPLYSAATLVVDAISTAPVHEYSDRNGGRVRVNDEAVVGDPGLGVNRVGWLSQLIMSLLLRGNAFGFNAAFDGTGTRPTKVVWLPPDIVQVDESGGLPRYIVGGVPVDRGLITHIPGYLLPGSCVGLSPIGLFRTQLQTGQRVDAAAGEWYGQASNPRAVLANRTRALLPDEPEQVKDRYNAAMKAGDILVMGNDWSWSSLTVSPADAQFVSAAQMTANQVAAIYHVPAEEIGGTSGNSLTYSTVELNGIKFSQRAILPWTTRIETAWSAMLSSPRYVRFNLDGQLRADFKTRMDGYAVALKNGILTQDEARSLENREPLDDEQVTDWLEHYVKPAAAQPAPADQPEGGQA